MHFLSRWLLLGCLLLALTGCGVLRKNRKSAPVAPLPDSVALGTIEMVNGDQKFVLIHGLDRTGVPADTEVSSHNEAGETARLKVSAERKGVFLTADILSGQPQKGDTIVWSRTTSVPAAPAEPSARIVVPKADAPLTPTEPPSASISLSNPNPPPP